MIHLIIAFLLLFTSVNAKENINKKINKTSHKLDSFHVSFTQVNKKMAKTAKAILKQKRELTKQNRYLVKLKKELQQKESSYKENIKQLEMLNASQGSLKLRQEKIEDELVFVIAQSVSLSIILEDENSVNVESMIEMEVLKSMLKSSKKKVKTLNSRFFRNSKDMKLLNRHASTLKKSIAIIDLKRKKLIKTKKSNLKALKKLNIAKASYKKEVQSLLKKQDTLKKTLASLNLIKVDQIKKAKMEKERKIALEAKEKSDSVRYIPEKNRQKVKKHGSSYQSVKTKKYRGKKTIAPLDSYTITKKYGTYTDPIYGIKIFNESISLKPKRSNAKVKTVFNGKVIYAAKTAVLNNIVIVEHKNGLHTIYANLSQISNVKKGHKIKKGYTIGRVSDELIFEVTQKSYHINPIRLFQ